MKRMGKLGIKLHVFIHRRDRNMNGYFTATPVYNISITEAAYGR